MPHHPNKVFRMRWATDRGQVTSFMIKVVVAVAAVGILVVEFGSPFVTRVTLDNDAQNIVQEGAHHLARVNYDTESALEVIQPDIEKAGIEVRQFEIVEPRDGSTPYLQITVARKAKSLFAHNIGALKGYYDVEVTATAPLQ